MIAGAGFSFDWALVQPEAAKFTHVCTYDPAGMAWSEPGPSFSCPTRVDELHNLVRNAKLDGPYVLVGLSVGALVARYYAARFPDEVAGMVIVDHAFTNPGGARPADTSGPAVVQQTPIVITVEDSSQFRNLPEQAQRLHRWADSLHPSLPTVEMADQCMAALKAEEHGPNPLGDKPLVVISTGNQNRNYKKLQTELLTLSTRSEQLLATHSFHAVEIDEPEMVVQGIEQVVDLVRRH